MARAATTSCIALEPDRRSEENLWFESELRKRIVGQEPAVKALVTAYQGLRAGLVPEHRPIRNFLFLGPTGSGKTRLVEAAAEVLFRKAEALIKIDCAEFQHGHEIAKLVGSPPGYLGHRETPPMLTQQRLDEFHTPELKLTLVLFDEIEKAHETLWQLLLGVLDKGVLTLGDNQRVDFSRAMIFMTSNLGASEMQRATEASIGFAPSSRELKAGLAHIPVDVARRRFSPEFLNRLDEILVFEPLSEEGLKQVLAIEIEKLELRLSQTIGKEMNLHLSDDAVKFLLARGTDRRYGARHLKRALEKYLVFPISSLIATRQIDSSGTLNVGFDRPSKNLNFCKQPTAARALEPALSSN